MIESNGTCFDTTTFSLWIGTVGVAAISHKQATMLSPNPVSDEAIFTFPSSGNNTAKIVDMLGNQVMLLTTEGKQSLTFNRNNLKSGIYFYQISDEKNIFAIGKMMVE